MLHFRDKLPRHVTYRPSPVQSADNSSVPYCIGNELSDCLHETFPADYFSLHEGRLCENTKMERTRARTLKLIVMYRRTDKCVVNFVYLCLWNLR